MELLTQLLAVFVSAILMENVVFSRALGLSRTVLLTNRANTLVVFNISILYMCVASSLLGFGANYLLVRFVELPPAFVREGILLAMVVLSYGLFHLLLSKKLPQYLALYQGIISFAAFNCAVYGSLMITINSGMGLAATLVRGLGTGCGLIAATWLIYFGHKRIELCDLPRTFRGLPITLLYIGIISLALYGLVGHSLPT